MIEYLVSSTVCLGVLYLTYHLLLSRQRLFTFNRIFLLGSLVFSFTIAFIEIDVTYGSDFPLIRELKTLELEISSSNPVPEEQIMVGDASQHIFEWHQFIIGIYSIGFLLMVYRLVRNIYKLEELQKKGKEIRWKGHVLVLTSEKIYPFSFLERIYIHDQPFEDIDREILQHESVHIRQKHSYDILFTECLLIIFWFQPLLYLFRKVITTNHEYIADSLTVNDKTAYQNYFRKILETSNHPLGFRLESSFSFISIKKRIKMMMIKKSSKRTVTATAGTVVVVLLMLFSVFSFNIKPEPIFPSREKFVVILDAGHGGKDLGAQTNSNLFEKDIALSVSKKIKERLANSRYIEIRQTREQDRLITLKDRISQTSEADLFISLHLESYDADESLNYKLVLYSENQFKYLSMLTAAALNHIAEEKNEKLKIEPADYYVLKNAACPALLVNVGFLSNRGNAEKLRTSKGQDEVANQIADAIGMTALIRSSDYRKVLTDGNRRTDD